MTKNKFPNKISRSNTVASKLLREYIDKFRQVSLVFCNDADVSREHLEIAVLGYHLLTMTVSGFP